MLKEINNSSLTVKGDVTFNKNVTSINTFAKVPVSTLHSDGSIDESVIVWNEQDGSWETQQSVNVNGIFTTTQEIDLKNHYIEDCLNTFKVKCSFTSENISFTPYKISSGRQSVFLLTREGSMYSTGKTDNIALGNLFNEGYNFIDLNNETLWSDVKCGGRFLSTGDFTVALDNTNKIWTWGDDTYGQCAVDALPTDGTNFRSNPGRIVGNDVHDLQCLSVDCGEQHAAAISVDGSLYMWGRNSKGCLLNLPEITRKCTLFFNSSNKKWRKVSCGAYHTAAIDDDGKLFSWGSNDKGQLGVSSFTDEYIDTPISPLQPHSNLIWKHVSCGADFTVGLDSNDVMYLWGSNASGQLGQNDINLKYSNKPLKLKGEFAEKKWKSVVCGGAHIVAIDLYNNLYVWGNNRDFQLGLKDVFYQHYPVLLNADIKCINISAGLSHSFFINKQNVLFALGTFKDTVYQTPQRIKCVQKDVDSDINYNVVEVKSDSAGVYIVKLKQLLLSSDLISVLHEDQEGVFVNSSYNVINQDTLLVRFTKFDSGYSPRKVLITVYRK
jgi:alpha-tubulin suppressor-like RCC1 family protein